MRYLLALFTICAIGMSLIYGESYDPQSSLPIGLTEEELTKLDQIGQYHLVTDAPPGTVRNPAEWEPSEGVIIRYPLGIPVSLVAEMSEDITVVTIVANQTYENYATSDFNAGGVNMSNVEFIHASTNSWWTRDYGPWFIFEDDTLAIVDHIYNRPRPLDDLIPGVIGSEWGLNVYGMDLITTGGNHMSNGLGTSMSTELVYDENPGLTEAEVDAIMFEYLGNDYDVLNYIESGGIHHIDCWAKFLSPSTILVKDVPSSSPSYSLLNARAAYLSGQISPYGTPYNVVRVYCPYGTAYTNSIILNDKVLVPIFNSSWDDDALATYETAMPGYEVIGFTGSWYDDDAIHCRAMGVPDRGMLYIQHVPVRDTSATRQDYLVGARIKAYSGASLRTDSLKVYYRVDQGAWSFAMLNSTADPDSFFAYIPSQTEGAEVAYYIQAGDLSGRVETHPYIGAPGAHTFAASLAEEIPTLSEWGMIILALMLLAGGTMALIRRQGNEITAE